LFLKFFNDIVVGEELVALGVTVTTVLASSLLLIVGKNELPPDVKIGTLKITAEDSSIINENTESTDSTVGPLRSSSERFGPT
jgi:hypothetical protein